jgi:hypothetical protein
LSRKTNRRTTPPRGTMGPSGQRPAGSICHEAARLQRTFPREVKASSSTSFQKSLRGLGGMKEWMNECGAHQEYGTAPVFVLCNLLSTPPISEKEPISRAFHEVHPLSKAVCNALYSLKSPISLILALRKRLTSVSNRVPKSTSYFDAIPTFMKSA